MESQFVYKFFRPQEWNSFNRADVFNGSIDDQRDGFIHFSLAPQLKGTLAKYYTDGQDIILAKVDGALLGAELKYEPSRGGDLFPHVYGALLRAQVITHWRLPALPDASYELPELEQ